MNKANLNKNMAFQYRLRLEKLFPRCKILGYSFGKNSKFGNNFYVKESNYIFNKKNINLNT